MFVPQKLKPSLDYNTSPALKVYVNPQELAKTHILIQEVMDSAWVFFGARD